MGVIQIKKLAVAVSILIVSSLLFGTSYALWRHNAEVKFKLTISEPVHEENDCICGTYSTIEEGIDLLKNTQYNKFYDRMDLFKAQLLARAAELNNLPFGSITSQELSEECDQYRNVDIAGFGTTINIYGTCINALGDFYNNSTQKEKDAVPDFWDQSGDLWDLHGRLWDKREELYTAVNAVQAAGQSKIDYDKKKK